MRRSFPAQLKVAAVGRGSADALEALGVRPVIAPEEGADSESLLRVPELEHVAEQRIVIFRGVGGRELLRDTLVARGASVEYAECYRRVRPEADRTLLMQSWSKGEIDAIVVTSSEGLRNLHDLIGADGRELLAMTPVFASHERIAATASELGLKQVFVTRPGDRGIAASLAQHFGAR
jgi:uroporphyrinogen-III synthase